METVILAVGLQKDAGLPLEIGGIPHMSGFAERAANAGRVIASARRALLPIVFCQEVHRPDRIDFGRELDGAEGVHCIEGDLGTELIDGLGPEGSHEYLIQQRRYSSFFGTDLEILLRGLKADRLIMLGSLTDVNIHYTFVEAHMRDYHLHVLEDCGVGSSEESHAAAMRAMAYLQRDSVTTTERICEQLHAVKLRHDNPS